MPANLDHMSKHDEEGSLDIARGFLVQRTRGTNPQSLEPDESGIETTRRAMNK